MLEIGGSEDLLQSEIIYHLNSFDNNTWPHLESHFDVDESYIGIRF